MTDEEKMRELFDAALRAPDEPKTIKPAAADSTPATAPAVSRRTPVAVTDPSATGPGRAAPAVDAGLDHARAAELEVLLDEQRLRIRRRHRRQSLITALVLLGFAGGGYAWFIQPPQWVQAFREAINDIRSVGDVASIVAKYNKALEKIKVRSTQTNGATNSMGIAPAKDDGKYPPFEREMKDITTDEGKTMGERNRLLKEKFGSMEKAGSKPGLPVPAAATPPPSP